MQKSEPSVREDLSERGGAFAIAIRDAGSTPVDPLVAMGMDLEPRKPHPQMQLQLPPGEEIRMTMKFMDWSMARLNGDNQLQVSDASLQQVNQLVEIARKYDLEFAPTFDRPEALDDLRIRAAQRSGHMQADFNGTIEVELKEPSKALKIAQAMQEINIIEYVELASIDLPAPPPGDIAPPTPDLEFEQDYLATNPGLGVDYLKALGADGSGVRFTDVEHT